MTILLNEKMHYHGEAWFPNINFLKTFWKAVNGVSITWNFVLFTKLYGFCQSCISEENSIYFIFSLFAIFSRLLVWCHLWTIRLILYFLDVLKHQKVVYVSSRVMILKVARCPLSWSNFIVRLISLTRSAFWCAVKM